MTKRLAILFIILITFVNGCLVDTVKEGDTVSVGFIAKLENGTIFDTSYEDAARRNDLYVQGKRYEPLNFTAGEKQADGLDEGVPAGLYEGIIGMRVGEKRTLRLPPEKAYGTVDPEMVDLIPLIQELPSKSAFNRTIKFIRKDFNRIYGGNHTVGETVKLQGSTAGLKIEAIEQDYVQLAYTLKAGDTFRIKKWNFTVTDANETSITTKYNLKLNDTGYFFNGIWNSTVINISDTNVTFKHNAVPNQTVLSLDGWSEVSFNETHIIIDYNNPLAGKTLIYEVELLSIRHPEKR